MRRGLSGVVAVCMAAGMLAACSRDKEPAQLVIGSVSSTSTALRGSTIALPPDAPLPNNPGPLVDLRRPARPEPAPAKGLKAPDGRPYDRTLIYKSVTPVPTDLVFVLVVGSDARPNQDVRRTNGDSVHVLAVNPRSGQGTILGLPRDAWVEVPGHGTRKLTTALQFGPEVMAQTVRKLTGLPMPHYMLTGFVGLPRIVDDLGGVDVYVDRRMNDPYSGARFERGWHHFDGQDALAFSRNRHDVAHGDFSRSENHGKLILAALSKLRAEVGDEAAMGRWLDVLRRHAIVDMPLDDLRKLGSIAARLDVGQVRNAVVPGRVGSANGESVVFLGSEAAQMFEDLRPDAVLGSARPATTTTTEPPTTTTTAPPPIQFGTTSSTSPTSSTTTTTEPGDSP